MSARYNGDGYELDIALHLHGNVALAWPIELNRRNVHAIDATAISLNGPHILRVYDRPIYVASTRARLLGYVFAPINAFMRYDITIFAYKFSVCNGIFTGVTDKGESH